MIRKLIIMMRPRQSPGLIKAILAHNERNNSHYVAGNKNDKTKLDVLAVQNLLGNHHFRNIIELRVCEKEVIRLFDNFVYRITI
ncbi:unnamed protein product [Cylicocyclus nassatus]|uniref:Uncharacterized protein n=1 Tax=Cylicocyclus nassatus TaxID=53992 RepID=A0AA36H9W2_CYLNA|nr:unnamed protein product [Cylicocyclus nassatus]